MPGSRSRIHWRTVLRCLAGDGRGALHEDPLHHPLPVPGHPLPRTHDQGLILPPGCYSAVNIVMSGILSCFFRLFTVGWLGWVWALWASTTGVTPWTQWPPVTGERGTESGRCWDTWHWQHTESMSCSAQGNCQLRDHEPTPHFPCLARNPAHSVVIAWSVRALTDRAVINYWVNGRMRDEGVLNTEVWTPFILWDCFLPPGQSATCTDFSYSRVYSLLIRLEPVCQLCVTGDDIWAANTDPGHPVDTAIIRGIIELGNN